MLWNSHLLASSAHSFEPSQQLLQSDLQIFPPELFQRQHGIFQDFPTLSGFPILGSLRIDDFFHHHDICTAESPTMCVQKGVAQDWALSHGRWQRPRKCFRVVARVSQLGCVVTFFCAILRLLSLDYIFNYLRRYSERFWTMICKSFQLQLFCFDVSRHFISLLSFSWNFKIPKPAKTNS